MPWFTVGPLALAIHVATATFGQRSTVVASFGDEAVDSWIGSVAFIGSVVAIGVIAAVVVWNVQRNRRL